MGNKKAGQFNDKQGTIWNDDIIGGDSLLVKEGQDHDAFQERLMDDITKLENEKNISALSIEMDTQIQDQLKSPGLKPDKRAE